MANWTLAQFFFGPHTVIFNDVDAYVAVLEVDESVDKFLEILRVDNKPRKWGGPPYKPCVSHALELIKQATRKPPPSNQAQQRKENQKPKLAVATTRRPLTDLPLSTLRRAYRATCAAVGPTSMSAQSLRRAIDAKKRERKATD